MKEMAYSYRVAANILNKQLLTGGKGWSSSWKGGVGLKSLTVKNKLVRKRHKGLGT
jgi:hypothetical protein